MSIANSYDNKNHGNNYCISQEKSANEVFFFKRSNKKENDPIKVLESLKENIQEKLEAGKISEEKAEFLNARIEKRIKEVRDFNKLSLEEKKSKLISDLESRLNKKVLKERIPQEKADEILKTETEKIQNWDGKSYPEFLKKYFFRKHR